MSATSTRSFDTSETDSSGAFHRLVGSNLAAQLAEQMCLAAAPLVAVLVLGAGAGGTGLLQAAQTLPFLLLSIPAGMLADRLPRHALMAVAETVRLLSLIAIVLLLVADHLSLTSLAVLGFVGTIGTVGYSVCAPALTPTLVPRSHLAAANGRLELVRSIAYVSGPALGGAVVGWLGASPTFVMATVLSALAVLLLAGISEPQRAPRPPTHPLDDLREGMRFLTSHALLRPITATAVVFNLAYFVLMGVYVAYAHEHMHLSAGQIGITLALYGVGMLVGAMLAGPVMRRLRIGLVICIGPTMGLLSSVVMVLTIWLPTVELVALSFILIGMGPMIWTISSTTLRQLVTPDRLLGRVSATMMTATFGARPLGAGIGALVGSTISLPACLFVALTGFALQWLIIVRSPSAQLHTMPDAVD